MAEWLLLLLLVPAIVVPVVLLVGFAGCSFDPDTTKIIIDSATPNSVCHITLKWHLVPDPNQEYHPPLKFLVQRTTDSSTTTLEAAAGSSSFDDKGLLAATTYSYTVTAVFTFRSDVSSDPPVLATTPSFQPTFPQQTLPNPDGGWQGWTLVQRIARLTTGGTQVRITLQASSAAGATGASIDRIYISQPAAPGMGINPWDSAADLTKIYDIMDAGVPLVMAAGEIRTVPAANQTGVNYNLDPTQALLIAVDFTDGRTTAPASAITYADMVPAVDATAYFFQYAPPGQNPQPQAQLQTRAANYTTHIGRLYFQLIEVG